MIEKFNFYDVYGYFLPGAAFLAVLWVPVGLVREAWPSSDWSSAIIAAALAYILGLLLQSIATNAIPSREIDHNGKNRYPSGICLDSANSELPESVKVKIAELMAAQFGLNLEVDKLGDEAIDKVRNGAFLFARQTLIQEKAASYAEQFQGMYALTRGLVVVLALGFSYWLGWAVAAIRGPLIISGAIFVLAVTVLILINLSITLVRKMPNPAKKQKAELIYASLLLVAFLAIGYILGARYEVAPIKCILLGFLAAWALIASFRAYGSYKFFARHFASTVWRDYLVYNVKLGDSSKSGAENK